MKKKKKTLIITSIVILFLITGFLVYYFLILNKYELKIYQYLIDNKTVFSEKTLDTETITAEYKIKCNNKCSLVYNEYEHNYFGISNKNEGYIYDISNNEIYDVGSFHYFRILYNMNQYSNYSAIGIVMNKFINNIGYSKIFNISKKQLTIPWTKDFVIGNIMINDNLVDTSNKNIFVNVFTGKKYNIDDHSTYNCYTPNTCVFYEESGYGFIYNFSLDNKYYLDYDVLIDYVGGAIVKKDNKYFDIKFGKDESTLLFSDINYEKVVLESSYTNKELKPNELLIGFIVDKESNNCPIYVYNIMTKKLNSTNNCNYSETGLLNSSTF